LSSGGESRIRPGAPTLGGHSLPGDADGSLPIEIRAQEAGLVLIELENNLLRRLRCLQRAEARLWNTVSVRRRRSGRRAVRQIERERQRLGRELHTGVGQLLSAIRIQVEIIERRLPSPPTEIREALLRMATLATQALEEVRGISRQLYAPEWQRLPLDAALRQLWDTSGVPQRFTSSIEMRPLPADPDPDIKTLIYRAAQEALSNIVRHAQASRVDLMLTSEEGRIRLQVQDNGIGFDTARMFAGPADVGSGIGLRALREQATDLGGKLLVRSGPKGTTIEVSAPLSST
jgi:two-component system NarL family sensor kinase